MRPRYPEGRRSGGARAVGRGTGLYDPEGAVIALTWWARIVRFALLGAPPRSVEEVPIWAMAVPFRLWRRAYRYDGKTFRVAYGGRRLWFLPLRAMYLGFLLVWPLVAWARSWSHPDPRAWRRAALLRPDLGMLHPESRYTARELAWMRPDYAIGMAYAVLFDRSRADFFFLDDKRRFLEVARREGLPHPPTLTADEAVARGGEWIVKDPGQDLGYGVEIVDSSTLAGFEDRAELVVQERLRNHPDLLASFPDDAPLSTLRVITLRDEVTGEPRVLRCAIRIGRAGMAVDNTQQGGIWANIDLETGRIGPGVTKGTVGQWEGDRPIRFRAHPDTGRDFVGLRVPWWEEGRRMAVDAHRRLAPGAFTLGWDVGLAAGGPVFLEVNVWTTCYDYDPPDDAFGPTCRWILRSVASAGPDA